MNFLAPERLVLLVPVAAVAALYLVLQRRRRRYAVRFTNLELLDVVAPRRPGWRRHVAVALAGLSALAIAIALAQPTAAMTVDTEEAVIMLAVDTSTSMEADDVSPNRLAAAVATAQDFVEDLPDDALVGLVAFDGTARLVAAPTDDHDAVVAAIGQLTTSRGTAAGDAVETALAAIETTLAGLEGTDGMTTIADDTGTDATTGGAEADAEAPPATIVLLSDGETTVGLPLADAAALAVDAGIPVSTITYGTDSGTVTVDGTTVAVPPAADQMAELADATGGDAFEAASADELASVYDSIESRIATVTEERELTLAFVAVGLVALLAASAAAFVWTGRFL